MLNKTCENVMNEYLSLDKNQRVPFKITCHLLFCKECRKTVRMLAQAEKTATAPLLVQAPLTDKSIESLMDKINMEDMTKSKNPISLTKWIIAGIVMLFMLFAAILYVNQFNSRDLALTYALLIAGCTIAYCSAFVWCNMDFFVKKLSVKLVK